MVSLVYAFRFSLLALNFVSLVQELLRNWCGRTGETYCRAAMCLQTQGRTFQPLSI